MKTGLWEKTSNKGVSYATGKIKIENKEYKVLLFKNNDKKTEKSPDFNIMLEEVKEDKKNEKQATDEQIYADFGNSIEISDDEIGF